MGSGSLFGAVCKFFRKAVRGGGSSPGGSSSNMALISSITGATYKMPYPVSDGLTRYDIIYGDQEVTIKIKATPPDVPKYYDIVLPAIRVGPPCWSDPAITEPATSLVCYYSMYWIGFLILNTFYTTI